MKLLQKAHSVVTKAASTDETRYTINSVYLEETETGMRTTATDGRILAIVEDKREVFKAEEYPANVIPAGNQNGAKSAIVPVDAYLAAFKAIPKKVKLPVLQTVAVSMGKTETTFGTTDLTSPTVRTVKNIDETYPNYQQVIPTEKPDFVINFNPALLGCAMKMAAEMGINNVRLEFTTNRMAVKISGETQDQKLTVVVMPMKPDYNADIQDVEGK